VNTAPGPEIKCLNVAAAFYQEKLLKQKSFWSYVPFFASMKLNISISQSLKYYNINLFSSLVIFRHEARVFVHSMHLQPSLMFDV
jgi:hypothetical protein